MYSTCWLCRISHVHAGKATQTVCNRFSWTKDRALSLSAAGWTELLSKAIRGSTIWWLFCERTTWEHKAPSAAMNQYKHNRTFSYGFLKFLRCTLIATSLCTHMLLTSVPPLPLNTVICIFVTKSNTGKKYSRFSVLHRFFFSRSARFAHRQMHPHRRTW